MRTLNRPMFRYGGPIKEGVMNGIREPKKDGGPMTQRVQPSNDGSRPGYAGPASPFILAGMGIARAAPYVARGARAGYGGIKRGIGAIKNLFGKNVPKNVTVPKQGPFTQGSAVTKNTLPYDDVMIRYDMTCHSKTIPICPVNLSRHDDLSQQRKTPNLTTTCHVATTTCHHDLSGRLVTTTWHDDLSRRLATMAHPIYM